MFSVTMTSNAAASVTRRIAAESTSWCSRRTSGCSSATSMATSRQSRDDSRTFALSTDVTSLRRAVREAEREAHDAADLLVGVLERVDRARAPADRLAEARLAEVEAAGELADEEDVDARDAVRLQRRRAGEGRVHAHRAEVRVEAERLAEPEEALLGAHLGARVVPLRAADGAEQDRVGALAGRERLRRERVARRVDGRAADEVLLERRARDPNRAATCSSTAPALVDHLGADAVARRAGRSSPSSDASTLSRVGVPLARHGAGRTRCRRRGPASDASSMFGEAPTVVHRASPRRAVDQSRATMAAVPATPSRMRTL